MKIFIGDGPSWGEKVNFVDSNDVFVGYDLGQDCCEEADWFIADKITNTIEVEHRSQSINVENYIFDKDFFEEVYSEDVYDGGMVAFKLISGGKPDLYLHIYNSHNGYYGHGFEVKHSGEMVKEGTL